MRGERHKITIKTDEAEAIELREGDLFEEGDGEAWIASNGPHGWLLVSLHRGIRYCNPQPKAGLEALVNGGDFKRIPKGAKITLTAG